MALILNEEHIMLRDSASDFLNSRAPVSHFRELRDNRSEIGFDPALWAEMAEMGWTGILIPEEYGGLGYGFTGLGLILEQCGRTLSPSPLLSTALMGASALSFSHNQGMCQQWLPEIAEGKSLIALAVDESAWHRPDVVTTSARVDGDDFVINGVKTGVMDGNSADAFVVSARTAADESGEDRMSLFLVPADAGGLQIDSTTVLDNRQMSTIKLDHVRVSSEQLLATQKDGYELLHKVLDHGRVGMAAELLGIAQECLDRTIAYLKERKQFGVAIGSFQALQHRAATLFGEIELCRSVVLKACQSIEENSPQLPLLASLAKAKCGQVAELATAEAIQMHGGIGMTDQFDIGFFIKRWRALNQQLGDYRYHLDRFATLKGY